MLWPYHFFAHLHAHNKVLLGCELIRRLVIFLLCNTDIPQSIKKGLQYCINQYSSSYSNSMSNPGALKVHHFRINLNHYYCHSFKTRK